MTKQVQLSKGLVALVDDEDWSAVSRYHWCANTRPGYTAYAQRTEHGADGRSTTVQLHTFLTGWSRVDHRDGDGLNNQRANLRPATSQENQRNSSKRRRGSSPFKGVTWDRERGKWRAQIAVPGSKLHLGDFISEREAANAYDRAACELFGDFARPNFPKAGVA